MPWWLTLILFVLFVIGIIVSYRIAKIKNNKKILIATYIFSFLLLVVLGYVILDIILVGGIN